MNVMLSIFDEIKAKNKYFDIADWYEPNIDIYIIQTARNVGKTWNAINTSLKNWERNKEKSVFLRISDNQVPATQASIRSLTGWISRNHEFYEPEPELDKHGNPKANGDVRISLNAKPISYVLGLSNASKYKSMEFPDVKSIYFEEYNQKYNGRIPNSVQWENFISVYKSIERNKCGVKCFLLGNNDSPNNVFLEKFEIDVDIKTNNIQYCNFNNGEYSLNIKYVYIQDNIYNVYANASSKANILAGLGTETKSVVSGSGWGDTTPLFTDKFNKNVKNTWIPHYNFSFLEYNYTIGEYNGNKQYIRHRLPQDNDLPIFALDSVSSMFNGNAPMLNEKRLFDFSKFLFNGFGSGAIKVETQDIVQKELIELARIINKKR